MGNEAQLRKAGHYYLEDVVSSGKDIARAIAATNTAEIAYEIKDYAHLEKFQAGDWNLTYQLAGTIKKTLTALFEEVKQ